MRSRKKGGMRKVRKKMLRINPFVLTSDSLTRSAQRTRQIQKYINEEADNCRLSADYNIALRNFSSNTLSLTSLEKKQLLSEANKNAYEVIFQRRNNYPTIKHYIVKREKNVKFNRG